MRWLAVALLLALVVACESPDAPYEADDRASQPASSAQSESPPTASMSISPTEAATSASPTQVSSSAIPEPKVSWSLKLDPSCGPDTCVPRPRLSQTPKLRGNAAVVRSTGQWVSDLVVPESLASDYVSCEKNSSASFKIDTWTFVAKSDKDYAGEFGLGDDGGWFQMVVTDNGRVGNYSAEAVLAVSDGDLFIITDSTGNADNVTRPVLQWDWTPDRRGIRFAFRTASYPYFAYDRSDGIGGVLVAGTIRCPG